MPEPSTTELSNRLAGLVTELPERDKLIIGLYYYEHLTLKEIAGILNMTEEKVCEIMSKVLGELREKMNTKREG